MTYDENLNQHSDLVCINDLSEKNPIIIYAHQLNQYYHTLLGNPFQRLNYYNSDTKQYQFYRTPGIINYIITYYLHQGCLSTEIHYPPEILYDELVFFGFNIQIIYEIVSNLITIDYYIPSGKYTASLLKRNILQFKTEVTHQNKRKSHTRVESSRSRFVKESIS
jgi:hypothetical protein